MISKKTAESKLGRDSMVYGYDEDSPELTDWQYSTPQFGSNKITRYTIVAVTSALGGVLSTLGPVTAGVSAALAGVAGMIVSDEIPIVYYAQDVFYKFLIDTDPPLPRAERTMTTFYSDSGRTQQIGDTVVYEYYCD
jgi:hypothetical protein